MKKPGTRDLLVRVIPPLTVWAVTKLLDQPPVKSVVEKIDHKMQSKVSKGLKRRDRTWYAAGAAVIAIGLGLLARGTRGR